MFKKGEAVQRLMIKIFLKFLALNLSALLIGLGAWQLFNELLKGAIIGALYLLLTPFIFYYFKLRNNIKDSSEN